MTREARQRLKLAGAVLLLVASLLFLRYGDTSVRQHFRLQQAKLHGPVIERAIASDAELSDVKVGKLTGGGGLIGITGSVPSREAFDRLKRAIEQTQPPVGVMYILKVNGELVRE